VSGHNYFFQVHVLFPSLAAAFSFQASSIKHQASSIKQQLTVQTSDKMSAKLARVVELCFLVSSNGQYRIRIHTHLPGTHHQQSIIRSQKNSRSTRTKGNCAVQYTVLYCTVLVLFMCLCTVHYSTVHNQEPTQWSSAKWDRPRVRARSSLE